MARLLLRLLHLWFLVSRPLTLGVRVAAFTADGRVCLVRHSYVRGWHLPGGGVEPGEDAEAAARRELAEETGVSVSGPLRLFGAYHNKRVSRRDHVLLFRADDVAEPPPRRPDREIAGSGAFAPDALPDGTTAATRARLDELAGRARTSLLW